MSLAAEKVIVKVALSKPQVKHVAETANLCGVKRGFVVATALAYGAGEPELPPQSSDANQVVLSAEINTDLFEDLQALFGPEPSPPALGTACIAGMDRADAYCVRLNAQRTLDDAA